MPWLFLPWLIIRCRVARQLPLLSYKSCVSRWTPQLALGRVFPICTYNRPAAEALTLGASVEVILEQVCDAAAAGDGGTSEACIRCKGTVFASIEVGPTN